MKKLFLLLTLFGVICSSCSKEGDEVSNPQEPPKTEEDVLIIDGDRNYVVDALGGELVVKVKTNKGYGVFIPEEASWITLADTRSLREDELTFIISPNEEFAVRCATLTLSVDWDTFQEITIVQNPASIDIPNNQIWYTSTNGEIILPYIGRGNSYADALTSFGANIISNTYENGKGVITFDSDVTKIGECAFCGYYSFPLLPDSSEESEGYTLCRNLATILIPNSVTTIGDYAFMNCNSLISVTVPNSVLTIGSGSFRDCYNLISVTIGDSVTTIGKSAFDNCHSLTCVTIPDSVTTIGEWAFAYCRSLTSITIPDSVTTIGDYVFGSCSSLQEFKGKFASEDGRCLIIDGTLNSFAPAGLTEYTIPDSVTTIGNRAFDNCHSLTCVTIPDSVTTIGYNAFSNCSSLTSVTIPDSVTTVGGYAFCHCESLTDVALPNSVATIGNWAFECCSSLTSVAIGNGVTEIGIMAFQDCTSLTNVYCKAITPPTGSIGMFSSNASNRIIYVPRQSVESYISAEHWRTYASYILGYDFKDDDEEPSTSNNIITYTATSKVEPYSGERNNYADAFTTFGASIVSHSYENGKGVITFDNNVTKIGEFAFYECTSLESISIPDSVTEIGYEAFAYCTSLEGITIPDSVVTIREDAFYECTGLESVTIGNSVSDIASPVFVGCSNLKEFKGKYASEDGRCLIVDGVLNSFAPAGLTEYTIPDSVTEIGMGAFAYCTSLESVTIGNGVTEIEPDAFAGCSNLKEFKGKYASEDGRCLIVDGVLTSFASAGLTEYIIPDSVTTIGEYAFGGCSSLTSVTIPDSVVTIGKGAFEGCTSLESVTIGNGVTKIGEWVFSGCTSLESVTIPDSVVTIGKYAFSKCTSLESINIPDSVVTIGEYAFPACTSLESVTIGNGVTEIGKATFNECTSLKSVTIGNSVTEIGKWAFLNCENLESVTIPDSVVTIGLYAFENCIGLKSVTIGNSVTEIGEDAFSYCENLEIVYCKPFTPPYLGSGNFNYVQTIYVPAESIVAYKTVDVWYEFADYYIGYDFEKGEVVEPAILNNTISYTATSKVEPYSGEYNNFADALTSFGANIVSHSYENGKGVITFDNDVTKIGKYAFLQCTSLESITIPDSVTEIGWSAFEYCYSLTSVTIPDSVTTIGDGAFAVCSSLQDFNGKFASEDGRCLIIDGVLNSFAPAGLTEYTIPDSVTTIGEYAFYECTSLESVTIPDSVVTIGMVAFSGCTSLESIDIPNSVTEIGDSAFVNCSNLKEFKGKYASEDGRCLIVDGVLTSFAPAGLTEYTIPDSVTEIGWSAFMHCRSLESVTIPDSVTEIGIYAFLGCTSLESITIPESVTEIGVWAFTYCNSLESVYCKSTIPPTCSGDPFDGVGFRIYVPKDSVDMYRDAPYWNSYSHCIVAYDYKNNCIYRPETSDIVKTWLGTYSAYTEEIIDIREHIVREQRTDFRFSVEPIDGADDQVYVYGLSVLGSDVPVLGHVWTEAGVNYLAFYNQFTVAEFSSGYDPTWLPYCILSDGSYSFVTGDYYPMAFMMSADGTIQGLVRYGEVNDGRGYEVVAFDLVALDFNNGVFRYYYDEYNNPYTQWKHGVVKGITKVQSASVSRKSVDLNQFIVGGQLPCSVVVAQ